MTFGRARPRSNTAPPNGRVVVRVRGLIQGVGFRPHVARTAMAHGISGVVFNDADGVMIEAEGDELGGFLASLAENVPPLARIDQIHVSPRDRGSEYSGFEILPSDDRASISTVIGPDVAICNACLGELFDPNDRRYAHPFICCTDCGPRYTVTESLPYDRDRTVMSDFEMCGTCNTEYTMPDNRRFHAEPIACHDCGPKLSMPVSEMAWRIARGETVAIKGMGGFHFACDATNEAAVERLRSRKRRDGKPFAVMVLNVASVRALTDVAPEEASLLVAPARPIVVLDRRAGPPIANSVTRGLDTLGVFLPYTPVHYLLFHEMLGRPNGTAWLEHAQPMALVMTSANRSGEALVIDDDEAHRLLVGIADRVATHDRRIVVRNDDSVVRVFADGASFIRRARGYAPLALPRRMGAAVIALGAHLKATVTVTRGDEAFISPHVGDLDSASNRAALADAAQRLLSLFQIEPIAVACDLHRDYASSQLAEWIAYERQLPIIHIQHHHAHIAAVLGEHRHDGPALGLALDGHGLGSDGAAWGGELLRVDGASFERIGHLAPLAIVGGDRAARETWRMAASVLHRIGRTDEIAIRFANERLASDLARVLEGGAAPTTTSAGRYFDAVAGLLAVTSRQLYEGEAPMRLERLARETDIDRDGWTLQDGVLSLDRLLCRIADIRDARKGAALFHGTLAAALTEWVLSAVRGTGLDTVALGGGCFLNRVLTDVLIAELSSHGVKVLRSQALPPNDGSLSYGQAVVASYILKERGY